MKEFIHFWLKPMALKLGKIEVDREVVVAGSYSLFL